MNKPGISLLFIVAFIASLSFAQAATNAKRTTSLPPEYKFSGKVIKKKVATRKSKKVSKVKSNQKVSEKKKLAYYLINDSVSAKKSAPKRVKKKVVTTAAPIQSNTTVKKPAFREFTENLTFNYYVQFLGPSLSNNYQDGATYNRFKTGQDWKGDEMDATGSHQMFHAITLGYKISNDYNLSYGYTFQEDLNKDIKYKVKNLDGSYSEFERAKGVSDNNKRINLSVYNVINNQYVNLSTTYFYEFSTTVSSESEDREYGLGFMPTLSIYSGVNGLYTGVRGLIQRNYFKQQQYNETCFNSFTGESYDCPIPTRYQTLLVELSPYLNYAINDYVTFKSSLTFDWDQQGDQVNSTKEYNKNMNDVGRIGVDFNIDYGVTAGTFIEFGLEEASLAKTAIGATMSISLY